MKFNLFTIVISTTIIFTFINNASAKYSGGTGEPNDPYIITTAQDLIDLGNEPNDYDKHFIQDANIDLSEYIFEGALIAWDTNSANYYFDGKDFNGSYDGQGYIINNLHIQGENYLGMFGCIGPDAMIMKIALENTDINGVGGLIGSLVGCNNNGQISLCHNNGTVRGNSNTGGLIGRNSGIITLSYNSGLVIGNNDTTGGLVAYNASGSIISCYNSSEISGESYVGGLTGKNYNGYIIRSYSTGHIVKGTQDTGGLVGTNCSSRLGCGIVKSCFWDIQTSGLNTSDGGTGLTTAQMQDINTYLNAGWDFIGEQINGTHNFWSIQDGSYPKLMVFSDYPEYELQGSGTIDEPYLIFDANDLGIIWHNPAAHYSLEADINLSDITWNQAVVPYFKGSFNGNDHIINSLHIEGHHYSGLFGKLGQNTEISNLILESVDVNSTGDNVGSLAGYGYRSNITKCQTNGSVKGNDYVGGLAGGISRGNITECQNNGTVNGYNYVGGLVGEISQGNITKCQNNDTVNGYNYVGGLIGYNSGYTSSSFSNSTVMGNKFVGGLTGYNGKEITSCYSTGTTLGSNYVGGLVGESVSRLSSYNSYSTGIVLGDNNVGGMVGNITGKQFNTCFWDIETSGLSTSAGGIGKTTTEMQDINTFLDAGWDFIGETDNGTEDIWWIDNGQDYPRLWWELTPAKYSGGTGEPNDPYIITTAQDLIDLGNEPNDYDKHFIQDANIDMSEYLFEGALIAWDTNSANYYFNGNNFNGSYDGQGYIINNLHIQGDGYLGMFGCIGPDAIITNIALENTDINGIGEFIGSLAGYNNKGQISLCYNNGTVRGNRNVGGLVGRNSGTITLSYSTGPVDGNDIIIGGLVGSNSEGNILSCYNLGETSGYRLVGGLVGTNSLGSILCSFSEGKVSGEYKIGGLVGENGRSETYFGIVTSSFWDTETSGISTSDGGTGKTTAEMQDINTFLDAGWDFIGETDNGTEDIWWIDNGLDYPRLWWELDTEY